MSKKIAMRIVVLLIIGGSIGYYYMNAVNTEEVSLYYGEARSITYDVYTKVPGIIEDVFIEEGDYLEEGQVIAKMESEEAALRVEKAELAVAMATESVNKATGPAREQEIAIQENTIGQLEQQIEVLNRSISSLRQSYKQSQLNTTSLKDAYALQKKTYEDRLVLYEAGEETAFNLSSAEIAMERGKNAYESSEIESIKIANEIKGIEAQIQSLTLQISSGEEALTMLKEGYSEADQNTAQLNREMSTVDVSLAKTNLTSHEVKTYTQGLVESVNFDKGEYISAGAAVATVMLPENLTVDLYVSEKDLLGLEIGMDLTMSLVVDSDVEVSGVITHIASEAMFTPVNIVMADDRERLVYLIEVTLSDTEDIRPGMLLSVDLTGLE